MMTKHSLRLTTLVFKIQVLFDATFTLNCSRFIGFCRKFYLISSITQNEHLFPFEQSFYAELQHFPGSSYLNGETFVFLYQHQNSFIKTFEERFFTLDTQHAHGTSFDSFEKILVPISSHDHSFWTFIQLLTSHIFDNICTISFPKVKPTSEQSIMMDVFRGAASIAFCLLSFC